VGLANLGSESETCVGSRLLLVVFPSPSRRIFIGSHSLPPLWFAVSVLQCLRLITQVGQAYATNGVLLDLGTDSQPHRPKNAVEHKPRASLTYTCQAGEHPRSDRFLLVKHGDFHRTTLHRLGRCNTSVKPVLAKKPQNTEQAYRAPNRLKLETAATRDNSEHTQTFTRAKPNRGLHRSDRCDLSSSG
jgi:hypothetical protein